MINALVAALLGVALGIALSAVLMRRQAKQRDRKNSKVTTISQVMHLALQRAPTGVIIVDISSDVILSNPQAHQLGLVHERTIAPKVWAAAERVFEHREIQEVNLKLPSRRAGGPDTHVHCHVTPLSVHDSRFVAVYAVDESELVRMEHARRDFVANVSHELKTPVGALSLLVEAMVQSRDNPEDVERFGASITRETQRLSTMITELIALSKLQGAEAPPDMEPIPVQVIIQEAINRTRQQVMSTGIEVNVDCPEDLVICGDKPLLVTALTNLVSNAVNYSPEQTPVSISCEQVDGDTVALRVTDRGIGISPADQERIFERFFRVDKARSRTTGGTGLGLAIVKHIVANHGGALNVWSRPGTGSTFTIELPVPDSIEGERN